MYTGKFSKGDVLKDMNYDFRLKDQSFLLKTQEVNINTAYQI